MKTVPFVSTTDSALPEHQIRERAYFRWVNLGCPHGDDQAHWFWARQQLVALERTGDNRPTAAPPTFTYPSVKSNVATSLSDPTHRFHDPQRAHDARLDVVAGEARQRVRGRHFDSSLRAQPKRPRQ